MTGSDESQLTYSGSGVNYGSIDPAKVLSQDMAKTTSSNLEKFGMKELPLSRGESAYVMKKSALAIAPRLILLKIIH